MSPNEGWTPVTDSPGGGEGGIVDADEEHPAGARICLERQARNAPWAITCGANGLFFHTRYLGSAEVARREYRAMRADLVEVAERRLDPGTFVDRYP